MIKRVIAAGIFLCAIYYTIVGALLYFLPSFFFARIGDIGTFNAHYERDAGSFILPLGLLLFFVARDPYAYWALAALAGIASLLHVGSHVMDGLHSPSQTGTLVFLLAVAIVLFAPAIAVTARARRKQDVTSHA